MTKAGNRFVAGLSLGLSIVFLSSPSVLAEGVPQIDVGAEAITVDVCMTCHGTYGRGSPVVGGPVIAGMEPWYLKRQLTIFRDGLRGTQRDYIPGYEMREAVELMTDEQIDNLSLFVSSWEPVKAPVTIQGDADHGKQLYTTCVACHGDKGQGNEALGAPGIAGRSDWYLVRQLKLFTSGFRGGHPQDDRGQQMRAMMGPIESESDMLDVVTYINSLEPQG